MDAGDPFDERTGFRVFVALDGSLASLAALRRAVGEARLRDAHLVAVRVLSGSGNLRDLDGCDEALQRARDTVWTAFEEALGQVPEDLDISAMALRGGAGPTLVDLADRADDLIVLGVGDPRPLRRWRARVTARHCVAHAGCPVLAVPLPHHLRALSRTRLRRRDVDRLMPD